MSRLWTARRRSVYLPGCAHGLPNTGVVVCYTSITYAEKVEEQVGAAKSYGRNERMIEEAQGRPRKPI